MEFFVTGGSGFLGQHLLRTVTAGGHRVRALARSHVAEDAVRGPAERFGEVNVAGTENVLVAARAVGVRRVVHVSSEAVLADGKPLVRVNETRPRPARPIGQYPRTKALAEELVMAADSPELSTVAVRPRFVWGPGDTSVLPEILNAAKRGAFAWIDGGRYLTSTCHVANACEGIALAASSEYSGQLYFLTDGEPVEFRSFPAALAATAGVDLGDRAVPRRLVWTGAVAAEGLWSLLRLKGAPPLTRTLVVLSGQEMTVDDSKARRELGYVGAVSREEGLADLAKHESGG